MGAGAGKTRQAASTSTPVLLSNGSIIPQFLDGGETNQILDHFHGLLKNLCRFGILVYNRTHQQRNGEIMKTLSLLEQAVYKAQRFHICYWAKHEAAKEGREYSDRLYRPIY